MPSLLLELTQMLFFYFCSLLVAHRGHNDFRSRVACHVWDVMASETMEEGDVCFRRPRLFDKRYRSAIGPRPERQQQTTIPGIASAGYSRPVAIIISMAVARQRSDCGFDSCRKNRLAPKRT